VRLAAGIVLVIAPEAVDATSTVTTTVHVLAAFDEPSVAAAASVPPLKVKVLVPAPPIVGVPQFVNVAAGLAFRVRPAGKASVNATLVSGVVCTLAMLTVMRTVPPGATVAGEKLLENVGLPVLNTAIIDAAVVLEIP
jgi:hypothetical protein